MGRSGTADGHPAITVVADSFESDRVIKAGKKAIFNILDFERRHVQESLCE